MREKLEIIRKILANNQEIDASKIYNLMLDLFKTQFKGLHVENYIGDYPTFIEPVYLSEKVKLGDDVLIGPNVYVGSNSEIGDYAQLTNSIIFDNVKIGANINLENCVVAKDSSLNFNNLNIKNCIIIGKADSEEDLQKISFSI